MKTVKTIMLLAHGGIAALDQDGRQIPDLQRKSAIELVADLAVSLGYSVEGCECRTPAGVMVIPAIVDTCSRCNNYPAEPLHQCPYGLEINDDPSLCNCCDECQSQCSDEI